MASIMNPAIRKTIQILLFTKYIEKLGLKEPKIPDLKFWTEFQLPPMPDVSALLEDVEKQANANPQDLFTPEYIKAAEGYNADMKAAKEKLDKAIADADEIKKKAKSEKDAEKAAKLKGEYEKAIETARDEYKKTKEKSWKEHKLDTIQKFKKLNKEQKRAAKKAANGETKSKKDTAKAAMNKMMQSAIYKQYEQYINKELEIVQRKVRELEKFYDDCKTIFVETPKKIKAYFVDEDGMGKQMIDEECDKIDRCWENLCEACKELSVDITTMVGKIPNPDVIVVGTAAGVPNPAHKIMVFMENVKKIATDIKKVLMYVKEMKSIAEALGFSMESIQAFLGMVKIIEALSGDYKKQFKNSVKQMQKKTKWVVETVKEVEDDDDDDENEPDDDPEYKTRKAGYKYADLDVDYENLTITIKGYRCYCTRNRKTGNKKKEFRNQAYTKGGGDHVDNKGKRYYWIPAEEMDLMFALGGSNTSEIDDGEYYEMVFDEKTGIASPRKITDANKIRNLRNANSSLYGSASYDYDNGTTTLVLADGRIVTIDYLANEGDKIKLNDGTYVQVV